MARAAPAEGRRPRPRHPVTPERLVAAAVRLTRERGLEGWTVRQLSAAVDAYPAVIYHHVGDRDAVAAAVIDRVVAEVPLPEPDLHWRTWFERFLPDVRRTLLPYRGVARRLALHGPAIPSARRIADRGAAVLTGAGFGDESLPALTLLLDQTCHLVAVEDDPAPGRPATGLPPEEFFHYALARTMDGLAARLADLAGRPG